MTENNWGQLVSGTLIKFPNDPTEYMVGEVFTNDVCKLYNNSSECIGKFTIQELKQYIV